MVQRLPREALEVARTIGRRTLVVAAVALATGSACALFLRLLDVATALREANPALLWLLPVAGLATAWCYERSGEGTAGGNDLVIDNVHDPGAGGVPLRLAPLVLLGSVATHLGGGSAGREGTAVQMGGSIASFVARRAPRLVGDEASVRTLLMSGVAAGFGGVFGTPLAGAVFALEVPAIGRMGYAAALPCLLAAVLADRACAWWGVHHTAYPRVDATGLDLATLAKVAAAGVAFGLAARLFSFLVHASGRAFRSVVASPLARPVVGGLLVIALVQVAGTRDYLGLGVSSADPSAVTILSAFREGGADAASWLWKTVFTALTLGASFKGGEVTPLFYIGATLGNALAPLLAAPTALMAALGFAAVFAGATNTPLACTIMAIELFGPTPAFHFGLACFVAYAASGHTGIYLSQRIATPKHGLSRASAAPTLRGAYEARRAGGTPAPSPDGAGDRGPSADS